LFLNFTPALLFLNIHTGIIDGLSCLCIDLKKYTGTSKFPFRTMGCCDQTHYRYNRWVNATPEFACPLSPVTGYTRQHFHFQNINKAICFNEQSLIHKHSEWQVADSCLVCRPIYFKTYPGMSYGNLTYSVFSVELLYRI
jgi:hypothetical protein